jgi:hypothetical protein
MQHATQIVATNLTVTVPPLQGFVVADSTGGAANTVKLSHIINVGDIAAGEERNVMIALRLAPGGDASAASFNVGVPTISYTSMTTHRFAQGSDPVPLAGLFTTNTATVDASRDAKVQARVLEVQASQAMTESMKQYERGDIKGAQKNLRKVQSQLQAIGAANNDKDLLEAAKKYDSAAVTMESQAPGSAAAQDFVKENKASAFQMRR